MSFTKIKPLQNQFVNPDNLSNNYENRAYNYPYARYIEETMYWINQIAVSNGWINTDDAEQTLIGHSRREDFAPFIDESGVKFWRYGPNVEQFVPNSGHPYNLAFYPINHSGFWERYETNISYISDHNPIVPNPHLYGIRTGFTSENDVSWSEYSFRQSTIFGKLTQENFHRYILQLDNDKTTFGGTFGFPTFTIGRISEDLEVPVITSGTSEAPFSSGGQLTAEDILIHHSGVNAYGPNITTDNQDRFNEHLGKDWDFLTSTSYNGSIENINEILYYHWVSEPPSTLDHVYRTYLQTKNVNTFLCIVVPLSRSAFDLEGNQQNFSPENLLGESEDFKISINIPSPSVIFTNYLLYETFTSYLPGGHEIHSFVNDSMYHETKHGYGIGGNQLALSVGFVDTSGWTLVGTFGSGFNGLNSYPSRILSSNSPTPSIRIINETKRKNAANAIVQSIQTGSPVKTINLSANVAHDTNGDVSEIDNQIHPMINEGGFNKFRLYWGRLEEGSTSISLGDEHRPAPFLNYTPNGVTLEYTIPKTTMENLPDGNTMYIALHTNPLVYSSPVNITYEQFSYPSQGDPNGGVNMNPFGAGAIATSEQIERFKNSIPTTYRYGKFSGISNVGLNRIWQSPNSPNNNFFALVWPQGDFYTVP